MAKALQGVRVIDFTQVIAGPFATGQLALLGADVIKVEQPGSGDQGRHITTDPGLQKKNMSAMFLSVNPGKRSLTLDLKHEAAKEVVHRLVVGADVFVENFRAGVAERLGYGYEALRAVRPDLIYCSISGYGQDGPKSGSAAYDGAIQAASGMMSINGHPETGPTRTGYTVVDMGTAITAAFAIMTGLYRRQVTGEGQFLDVAMLDTALTFIGPVTAGYLAGAPEPQLLGNRSPARLPTADVFYGSDGQLQVLALTQPQVRALCQVLGRADLLDDPRFATREAQIENREAMQEVLLAVFAGETTAVWEARLGEAGVPCAPVRTIPEAVQDPQLAHRGTLMELPAPQGFSEGIRIVRSGFRASGDGPGTDVPPPGLGQHTDDILGELGYGTEEIAQLHETGAV